MLAKLTSKKELTLPKAIVADFQDSELFGDVSGENRCASCRASCA